jgi:hypothetical protein
LKLGKAGPTQQCASLAERESNWDFWGSCFSQKNPQKLEQLALSRNEALTLATHRSSLVWMKRLGGAVCV